jgi:hypothetical protein
MGEISGKVEREFALNQKEEENALTEKLKARELIEKNKETRTLSPKRVKTIFNSQDTDIPANIQKQINQKTKKRIKTPNYKVVHSIVRNLLNEGRADYLKNYDNSYQAKHYPMYKKSNSNSRLKNTKGKPRNAFADEEFEEAPLLMKSAKLIKVGSEKKMYRPSELTVPLYKESVAFREFHHPKGDSLI